MPPEQKACYRPSHSSNRQLDYAQTYPRNQLQPHALADVVRQAARLLDFLQPRDWWALAASGQLFRQVIQNSTRTISVNDNHDLRLLATSQGNWPHLSVVIVRQLRMVTDIDANVRGMLKPTAVCQLSSCGSSSIMLLLRPSNQSQADQALSPTAAAFLQLPKWSQLSALALQHSSLSPSGIAQLAAVPWPNLRILNVSGNSLGSACTAQLTQAWPQLRSLDISRNNLDADAVSHLVKASWPLLHTLNLSQNTGLDAAAFRELAIAQWPQLTRLDLMHIRLNAACMHNLAQMPAPKLAALNLSYTNLTADAIAELNSAAWPLLSLWLQGNQLGAAAMTKLVQAPFAQIQYLGLADNKLDAAAVQQLAMGDWPELFGLTLVINLLDDAAMSHLAEGQWPKLRSLELQCNDITGSGVERLTHGGWPNLCSLDLDGRAISAQTWALLSLDPSQMPACDGRRPIENMIAHRPNAGFALPNLPLWPILDHVGFFWSHFLNRASMGYTLTQHVA